MQIDRRECPWYDHHWCEPWQRILWGMSICVAVDLLTGFIMTFASKAMETSKRPRVRQCVPPFAACSAPIAVRPSLCCLQRLSLP